MNAEIIAVGSEMLTPQRVDTNSLYITEKLNGLGIEVVQKSIVGDDRARLTAEIAAALRRSGMVILSGGLGPTEDDVTRDAVAAALGVGQAFRQDVCDQIADRFRRMKRSMAENNKRQAYVLDGADVLENPRGTAPGQWMLAGGRPVMLLPGPPHELKPMFDEKCMPRIAALVPPMAIRARFYRVAGMGESDLDQLIAPIYTKYENPVTTILASPGDIQIHFRARCAAAEEAEHLLAEVSAPVLELLGDKVYSDDGAPLEEAVGRLLRKHGKTLAVAESCTGGMLGERITSVTGSSDYFAGGFLTYTDRMKAELLGVDPAMLARHTAVSAEVADAMAAGARARTGADYALSVTGYADGEQAGLVYLGFADAQGSEARRVQLFGDRARVRSLAVILALDWLRRKAA